MKSINGLMMTEKRIYDVEYVERLEDRIEQLEAVLREIFRATSDENELLPLHYKQVQDIASKALAAEKKDD